jgi:hypothetical protein
MAKLSPEDRWRRHTLEQIKALRCSGELKGLRPKGLASLGRKKMYNFLEWWSDFGKRSTSPTYLKWYQECSILAERFGLAPWVVSTLCLLKGYKPENDIGLMALEANWPRVRLVTDSTNESFLRKLSYEAQKLGICVIQRCGSIENPVLNLDPAENGDSSKALCRRLGIGDKFFLRVETPVGYPPEAAAQLHREASQLAKEIARQMGYHIPKRLRSSRLVSMTEDLKIRKRRLPRGGSYDIIDTVYHDGDLQEDQKKRKLVSSRRYKLRKRLTKSDDEFNNGLTR